MVKIILAMLVAFVCSSCSKDNDEGESSSPKGKSPSNGQYVGTINFDDSEHSNTFCLTIENGACTDFALYYNAERFDYYTPAEFSTVGTFPGYTYLINGLKVQAQFIDTENFTADISGTLSTHKITDSDIGIGMVTNMALEVFDVHFKLDNTPLDANNVSFLDSKQ